MGAVKVNFWYALLAATTLIFGAAYTLWMVKRVFFGVVSNEHVAHLSDITVREKFIFAILAICVLAMGLYPLPFNEIMHASVNDLIVHLGQSKLISR